MFHNDFSAAARTVDALIKSLQDANGDVQNMAIRTIGPFVNKVSDNVICVFIDKVSQLSLEGAIDPSIPALALRSVVVSLPRPSPGTPRTKQVHHAYNALSRALVPRLVGYTVVPHPHGNLPKPPPGMLAKDMENGTDSNAIDVLTELANCFGPMLQEAEINALAMASLQMIMHPRTSLAVKRKAVVASAALSVYFTKSALAHVVRHVVGELQRADLPRSHRKVLLSLLGSVSRSIPEKFAAHIGEVAQFAVAVLSQAEIDRDEVQFEETEERDPEPDEVRESAMLAIETWLSSCPDAMVPFTATVLDIAIRFLSYDPNLAQDDDEEMIGDELDLDDDYEEDIGLDDEGDTSWKLRRGAARLVHVLIDTRSNGDLLDDGTFYGRVAPSLVTRFSEREEPVRLEVLKALSLLIQITGGNSEVALETVAPSSPLLGSFKSRKRRRAGSDASFLESPTATHSAMFDAFANKRPLPSFGAFQSLEALSPQMVAGLTRLLKSSQLPTKQAAVGVLKDLVVALRGNLVDYLSSTLEPVVSGISKPGLNVAGSSLNATNAYKVEALQYLAAVAEVQATEDLQPYVLDTVNIVRTALTDKYSKVASAALGSVESFITALTPPRSSDVRNHVALNLLGESLIQLIQSNETDLDIRRLAIHSLGMLLGRSSVVENLLSPEARRTSLDLLLARLKNETTRLAAARAIETISVLAKHPSDYPGNWVVLTAAELVEHFRKSSRTLRGASLSTMRSLTANPACAAQLTRDAVQKFVPEILPLIKSHDFHILGPALHIFAALVESDLKSNPVRGSETRYLEFVEPLGDLLYTAMPKTTMRALLVVVRTFGRNKIGRPLMDYLLTKVSLEANPYVVGKVVGTLLVSGEGSVRVTMKDFINELNQDATRQRLALGVLGETACLQGTTSKLEPRFFLQRLEQQDERTAQAAATALGRAGAGNIPHYVPVILQATADSSASAKQKQLLMLAIREIVHAEDHAQIAPFVQELWNHVMSAAQTDENRAIGSECIGQLAVYDPAVFFPQLQSLLAAESSSVSLRGLVLSAFRVTVTSDSAAAHAANVTEGIKPMLREVIRLIPREDSLENRRVAITILNAAAHSRMDDLLRPMLSECIAVILQETKVRKELVREVTMGPFKHKVDDGLDVRKVHPSPFLTPTSHSLPQRPHTKPSTHYSRTQPCHRPSSQRSSRRCTLRSPPTRRCTSSRCSRCTRPSRHTRPQCARSCPPSWRASSASWPARPTPPRLTAPAALRRRRRRTGMSTSCEPRGTGWTRRAGASSGWRSRLSGGSPRAAGPSGRRGGQPLGASMAPSSGPSRRRGGLIGRGKSNGFTTAMSEWQKCKSHAKFISFMQFAALTPAGLIITAGSPSKPKHNAVVYKAKVCPESCLLGTNKIHVDMEPPQRLERI
jgi:cullin-associated NEDD8-dissociated protein 1